jgi:hypothetical protein
MATYSTFNASPLLVLTSLALLSFAPGCGGSQEAPVDPSTDVAPDDGPKKPRSGIQAEIGALDEGKVKAAFKRVTDKLLGCYGSGTQRLPYLAGDVSFKVRVTQEGRARWIYVKDSTLGDRATEACMIDALKAITWPTPVDGEDGLAENSFSFAPSGDERMPVDWSPEQLGKPYAEAKPKLAKCRTDAGAGPLKVTLYVGTNGKPGAIGVSASDEKGEAAVQCVIDTLSGIKFPSPGSFASKVSVMID